MSRKKKADGLKTVVRRTVHSVDTYVDLRIKETEFHEKESE